MPEPINYMGIVPQINPIGNLMQGLQAGAAIQDIRTKSEANRLALQQQQQAAQAEERFRTKLQDYFAAPTRDKLVNMQVEFPQMKDAFAPLVAGIDKKQAEKEAMAAHQVYSMIENGNTDLAGKTLDNYIEAMKNSGMDYSSLENIRQALDTDPKSAMALLGFTAANLMGPEKFAKFVEARQAQELFPEKLAQEAIKTQREGYEAATKAEEAKYAEEKYKGEARTKTAESIIKQAEANAAPKKVALELSKLQSEIGKLAAEREKALREGTAATGLNITQRFDMTRKFRDEYSKQTGNFQEVRESYRRVNAAQPSGPGDIALIFSYMKMLDPGSVVREGEFATAQNSAGVPSAIANIYNKALSGERLTEGQRKMFKAQAGKLMSAASAREKEVRTGIERMASGYGISKDEIFYGVDIPQQKPKPKETSGVRGINPPAPKVPTSETNILFNKADAIIYGGK